MTFNSVAFLLFFPVVLLFHFLVPTKYRCVPLLILSYYFYACWNVGLMGLIIFTTAVSYVSGLLLERTDKKSTRRLLLAITLIACLGVLFFYKYFDFFTSTVSSVISLFSGAPFAGVSLELILPVGISFYTFQTLSYVIDVYRKNIPAEKNFIYYALFVTFFPQLVAGPIERPENLLPQLKAPHRFSKENFVTGSAVMLIGYFKKIAVADIIAPYVNSVFNNASSATGLAVILASCLFAVQIYCDFSGYTDIAIGCSRIMGIKLMQNFNRPYMSKSIKEFWSRWHISLSSWFKDYLYIPLGGNRCSKLRNMINIMIVFTVSGLWHGANMTFVLWGALHGFYQIIGRVTLKARNGFIGKIGLSEESSVIKAWRTFFTFVLVTFAWIFFRANSISDLGILLSKLVSPGSFTELGNIMGLTLSSCVVIILAIVLLGFFDRKMNPTGSFEGLNDKTIAFSVGEAMLLIWTVLAAWFILYSKGVSSTFIYFRF
ncbi:MAG: MBOAT family protein [Ruminococcaceae bacterium]|nr:MBOAT family protein [Oscillospiraceae bacterium]